MSDNELLSRFMIVISSPSKEVMSRHELFEMGESGHGSVTVYKVFGEGVPSTSYDVRHITYAGGFHLQSCENKTLVEFMNEIKRGLVKLASSGKID